MLQSCAFVEAARLYEPCPAPHLAPDQVEVEVTAEVEVGAHVANEVEVGVLPSNLGARVDVELEVEVEVEAHVALG